MVAKVTSVAKDDVVFALIKRAYKDRCPLCKGQRVTFNFATDIRSGETKGRISCEVCQDSCSISPYIIEDCIEEAKWLMF